ncbi:hypothetical protein BT93_L2511 [Corymbia citriodora subsp. variegata]|uniref:J domain-containing protein n=1 Tax=Corymbia citriodora subsp. variegata TaxID=360336 RepID=A0A8T0CNU4_CORYI|nr:hypothetical protein BT93_L2511 [Corymbia citriodora subsp. variegata]
MLSLSSPVPVPPSVPTARVRARRPSSISAATTFTSSAASKSQHQHQHQHPWLHRSPPCATPYEILGIPAGATSKEIKASYRRLARVLHPDAAAAMGAKDSPAHDDRFIRLHDAYSTLLDPEKRAVYDRRVLLARKRKRPAAAVAGVSGYGGWRNWETDQCW